MKIVVVDDVPENGEYVAGILHNYDVELFASPRSALEWCEGNPFDIMVTDQKMPGISGIELFGYEKGALSGATSSKRGFLAEADGGSLFLDEIGELPLPLQAKLLRVLQFHAYIPVGSTREIRSDFRLLCATNRNLEHHADAPCRRQERCDPPHGTALSRVRHNGSRRRPVG